MARILLLTLLLGQSPAPDPCSSPEYRQFDFWVGEWVVHSPQGRQVGTNRIRKIEGGCGLEENWTASTGTTGRSLNAYHATTGRWVQHWVGAGGSILLLEGTYDGEKMTLAGQSAPRVKDRITWSRLPAGKVRQLWEQSSDGGQSWKVAFDGIYSRREAPKE